MLCLSPVLYSRVFLVVLYLTRGKMNTVRVGREKWKHCAGIFVPERCETNCESVNSGRDRTVLEVLECHSGHFEQCEGFVLLWKLGKLRFSTNFPILGTKKGDFISSVTFQPQLHTVSSLYL